MRAANYLLLVLFFAPGTFGARLPLCGLRSIPARPEPLHALAINLPSADKQSTPVVIDVMFLYTPESLAGAGSASVMERRIQESIDEANYSLTNSQVNVTIAPAFISQIAYTESGDIQMDLSRLAISYGEFSGVNTLRDEYKADIVCLITERENSGIGGLAYDIPGLRGNSATAYLALRRQELGRSTTLAHELGHLFGCLHDREHQPERFDRRSYAYGYRLEIEGVTYIDIMAYEPGLWLPYFANPRLDLDGVPLGIPEGQSRPSDTARTINETAPYVAVYKQALSRIEFATNEIQVLRGEQNISVRLHRTGDISQGTAVMVKVNPESTAQSPLDYVLPASAQVQFNPGQSDANLSIPLGGISTGPKLLRLGLGSPVGQNGIGLQHELAITIRDNPPVVRIDSVVAVESSGSVELRPLFSGPLSTPVPEIRWHLQNDTAVAGLDYADASGSLQISVAGDHYEVAPLRIALLDDALPEPDKSFRVIFEAAPLSGSNFDSVTNEIRLLDDDRAGALLAAPGAGLNPNGGFNLAVRADRKLLVWGGFSRLGGVARTAIALLNPDGTLDDDFHPPEFLAGHRRIEHVENAAIGSVQSLPDGKYLVAGQFARANGLPRSTLARLNADGSLDDTFGKNLLFDGAVGGMALQNDGKVVLGGAFENINGQRHAFIARLNSDGTIDPTFALRGGPASSWTVLIFAVAIQPDGRILIGGLFDTVDGLSSPNLARLNPDGTIDTSFRSSGASGPVLTLQQQTDGRVIVGGLFDEIAGVYSPKLARLNPDGSADATFDPPRPNAEVRHAIPLPDGRMLIDGPFTTVGTVPRRFIAMLMPNGALDARFDMGTGPDERPGAMSIRADGSLFLGGKLTTLNSLPASGLARVQLGAVPSAILALTKAGEDLLLHAALFPGAPYDIETSSDLRSWRSSGSLSAQGFAREATQLLPRAQNFQFVRIKQ